MTKAPRVCWWVATLGISLIPLIGARSFAAGQ